MEVLRQSGIDALVPGQYVMVSYGTGPIRLMAREVHRIDVGEKMVSQQADGPASETDPSSGAEASELAEPSTTDEDDNAAEDKTDATSS